MKSRITKAKSYSPILHHCVVNLLGATRAVLSLWVGLVLCSPVLEASALPAAEELLQELQLSDSDRQSIREGKIVTWSATEGSDRELAVGMAMRAKTKSENLVPLFREAAAFKNVSAIIAYGKIVGEGTERQITRGAAPLARSFTSAACVQDDT